MISTFVQNFLMFCTGLYWYISTKRLLSYFSEMATSNFVPIFQQFEYMGSPLKLKGKLNFARSLSRLRANESEYEPCLPTDEARKKIEMNKIGTKFSIRF